MSKATDMFFAKINEDQSFAERIRNTKDFSQAFELAKEQGIELTIDDLKEIKSIALQVKEAKANTSELSEEELENVAGGGTPAISGAVKFSIDNCKPIISAVSSWSWPW